MARKGKAKLPPQFKENAERLKKGDSLKKKGGKKAPNKKGKR